MMLVQFSVSNLFSFDDEQVFSMVANSGSQHPTHLISDVPHKGDSLLRAAAIYGANAAGKSNLVAAIRFAQNLILHGTRSSQPIYVPSFKLGRIQHEPSKVEFVLKTQGVLYNYGFRLTGDRIHEEWLFATPHKQEVKYFERVTSDMGEVSVEFGPKFKSLVKQPKQFLQFVAHGTRPNQLFLTEALERNIVELRPLFDWFKNVCLIISAESKSRDIEGRAHANPQFITSLGDFLSAVDTGIAAIVTEELPFDFDQIVPEMPDWQRDELMALVAGMRPGEMTLIQSTDGERHPIIRGPMDEPRRILFKMQHRTKDGNLVSFDLEDESEGTQRLIHLLPSLFALQQNPEQVVIIDEIDRRLHPLLTRAFIQAALNGGIEAPQSQLIFTTHDTNLLDMELLRRDEIWFVEKDKGGASHLYSLGEFKIRPDLKIEKGYLNGRFGAIPFIGNLDSFHWHDPVDTAA